MKPMTEPLTILRPGRLCQLLLNALQAAEGQTRKRKRDQKPDAVGLALKRAVLLNAVEQDPDPEQFEAWLMAQALASPASGGVIAMCTEILDDYRLACVDPRFRAWLEAGAPSDDARGGRPRSDAEVHRGAISTSSPLPRAEGRAGRSTSPLPAGEGQTEGQAVCWIEFLGPARLQAGRKSVRLDLGPARTIADMIPLLAEECPALIGSVIDPERRCLSDGYIFNRNGRDFLPDPAAPIAPGDRLLLLSGIAGG